MNILITNHHLNDFAGSELFVFNLAKALKKRGDKVFVFSPVLGLVSEKIKKEGIFVTDNILDIEDKKIDIIHAQHNTTAILARSIFPNTPIIFMVHGVLPELEQPPSINLGISAFIAVSEEIKEYLVNKYNIDQYKIKIVRNFVDFNRFRCVKKIEKEPKKLLVLSNHYSDENKYVIESACRDLKIDVSHIGLPDNSVENVEDYINSVDIVVTLGRGALESMACERNVIIYDIHGGDGYVDENNFFEIRKNNFSGRRFGTKYSEDDFKKELLKYNPKTAISLKKIVEKENSEENIVKELENIYRSVIVSSKKINSKIKQKELFLEISILEKNANNERIGKEISIQQQAQQLKKKEKMVQQQAQQLKEKEELIEKMKKEIDFIKSSKFWKLRDKYLRIKSFINF